MRFPLKILTLFILAYTSLLYINYNLSFFKQIFAYHFYITTNEAPLKKAKPYNDFSCLNVNIVRSNTMFDRNEFILRGGSAGFVTFVYEVGGVKYETSKYSYIDTVFSCDQLEPTQIYYFPPYPAWGITDNSTPKEEYWQNFWTSTVYALFVISCLSWVLWGSHNADQTGQTIAQGFKANQKSSILIMALCLPFILALMSIIFDIFEKTNDLVSFFKNNYDLQIRGIIIFIQLIYWLGPSILIVWFGYSASRNIRIMMMFMIIPAYFFDSNCNLYRS